jgi:hypothetical protein
MCDSTKQRHTIVENEKLHLGKLCAHGLPELAVLIEGY